LHAVVKKARIARENVTDHAHPHLIGIRSTVCSLTNVCARPSTQTLAVRCNAICRTLTIACVNLWRTASATAFTADDLTMFAFSFRRQSEPIRVNTLCLFRISTTHIV
jgi:hypothetical protein